MGLFSGSKKTYVSSTLYNLAGDTEENPRIMSNVVLGHALSGGGNLSLSLNSGAPTLSSRILGTLTSPTARHQRRFFDWAVKNYSLGMPTGTLRFSRTVELNGQAYADLSARLGLAAGEKLEVLSARIDDPDVEYWAEAWIEENKPLTDPEDWSADYLKSTNEFIIQFSNGDAPVNLPAPADFIWGLSNLGKLLFLSCRILTTDPKTGTYQESRSFLHTYRIGSGIASLDGLITNATSIGTSPEFFPAIPMRIDNKSIRDEGMGAVYQTASEAWKKLTGSKIDEILDQIEDHENVGDMDFIYAAQGVPLNTKDDVAKRYLYEFFKEMSKRQFYRTRRQRTDEEMAYETAFSAWVRWKNAQKPDQFTNPLYGTPEPDVPVQPARPEATNEIKVTMEELPSFDMRLKWVSIEETQHVGNGAAYAGDTTRPHMKAGRILVEHAPPANFYKSDKRLPNGSPYPFSGYKESESLVLVHQTDRWSYRKIVVRNLKHQNRVYKDKDVEIDVKEALEDPEDSGFLVPLHYPTLRSLGASRNLQLLGSTSFLVINSYKVVKKKWWQSGIFSIFVIAASVALSVVTAGGSLAAAGGILGTNAAVGGFLGMSGAAAVAVGAVVNTIAGVALTTILSRVSTELLGDKIGGIIGAIVSFVALSYGSQYALTGNFAVDWSKMFDARNLMGLTRSIGNAYTQFLNADTLELQEKMEELRETQAAEMEKLEELSKEILGMTNPALAGMLASNASEHFGENSATFLNRTLMTGGDIVELSHVMVSEFADLSLELPKALGQS